MSKDLLKKAAGDKAAEYVRDGMVVGLGTGSTAYHVVNAIGRRVKEEGLDNNLLELIAADPAFGMSLEDLEKTMDPAKYVGCAPHQVDRYLETVIRPLLAENSELLGVQAQINV